MAEEAISLGAYWDDYGKVWTIGAGHTKLAGGPVPVKGMKWTLEQCIEQLRQDLRAVEAEVSRCIHVPLKQHEFDALCVFELNTGALREGSIDEKINAGNVAAAIATWNLYTKSKGKVVEGLVSRRKREIAMFTKAEYFERAVAVYDAYPHGGRAVDPARIPWPEDPAVVTSSAGPAAVSPDAAPSLPPAAVPAGDAAGALLRRFANWLTGLLDPGR